MTPPPETASSIASHAREERWRRQMQAAQGGDKAAYAALLREILPVLRAMVRRACRNPQDVDDVVQEVLLSLHAVRHTYDPARPFLPWLMTIARRRAADTARRASSRAAYETTADVLPETFPEPATKIEQEMSDDRAAISDAMAELTPGQREAVELIKVRGLSLKEAAALTGRSVSALKINVHRALRALRHAITTKS